MATHPTPYFTPGEYLESERKNDYKSEYLNGEISQWEAPVLTMCLSQQM